MNSFYYIGRFNKEAFFLHKSRNITKLSNRGIFKASKNRISSVHDLTTIQSRIKKRKDLLDFINGLASIKNG